MDWLDNEPDSREQVHEWTRLARRAAHRPVLSLAVALLVGALFLHLELRRPPLVAMRAELLVTESDMAFDRRRISRGDLRAFVEGVALSSRGLVPIMKRHGLWLDELERGPSLALAEMRKATEVEIFNDYFSEDRYQNTPARSARIAITFGHPSADVATSVAHELGELIARAELARHGASAHNRLLMAQAQAAGARRDLQLARQEIAALEALGPDDELPAEQLVHLRRWRAMRVDAQRRATETDAESTAAQLAWTAEEKKAGTRVHVASVEAADFAHLDGATHLARKYMWAGFVGLTLSLLIVGACDPRLYDLDDVRRSGWRPLGHLRGKG